MLSQAGSALTAGLCCTSGRTKSLSIPSLFPWTIVGSSRFCQDTWYKRKQEIHKWIVRERPTSTCTYLKFAYFSALYWKKKDKKLTTKIDSQGIHDIKLHLFLGREVLAASMLYAQVARVKISSLQQKHVALHHLKFFHALKFLFSIFLQLLKLRGFFFLEVCKFNTRTALTL